MARPIRDSATYFPLDIGFLQEKKIKLIKSEFGIQCIAVIIALFDAIYGRDGYFLKWDEDECLLMSDGVGGVCTPDYIKEVLNGCLRRSLFDERVFEMFNVLTSRGIQRRYLKIFERRDEIVMIDEYFLLDLSDKKDVPEGIRNKLAFRPLNCNINPDKCNINSDKCDINPPKKSKGKDSKEKETKSQGVASAPPQEVKSFDKEGIPYKCSKYLAEKILLVNPKAKVPTDDTGLFKWSVHVDRLLRLDKKDVEELREVLAFAVRDPFWSANILSTKNFREKYDQLYAKMKSQGGGHSGTNPRNHSTATEQSAVHNRRRFGNVVK